MIKPSKSILLINAPADFRERFGASFREIVSNVEVHFGSAQKPLGATLQSIPDLILWYCIEADPEVKKSVRALRAFWPEVTLIAFESCDTTLSVLMELSLSLSNSSLVDLKNDDVTSSPESLARLAATIVARK